MTEDPTRLHVLGVTATGELVHTSRFPSGWTPFLNVFQTALPQLSSFRGHVTDVAAARQVGGGSPQQFPEGLFVVVTTSVDPNPVTLFREAANLSWRIEPRRPITGARRVATATASSNNGDFWLHTFWVRDDGRLFLVADQLPLPGTIVPRDIESHVGLPPGSSRAVAAAGFNLSGGPSISHARLAAVTVDGRVWTAVVRSDGFASPFEDLEAQAGERGAFRDVAIARQRTGFIDTWHIAGVTGDGSAWLSRYADTKASGWRNLEEVEVTIVGPPGVVQHTRLVLEFGTFERIAVAITTEGLHVVVVTTDGRLLHQLDPSPGQEFRDVEAVGVGQDVGSFVAVACA